MGKTPKSNPSKTLKSSRGLGKGLSSLLGDLNIDIDVSRETMGREQNIQKNKAKQENTEIPANMHGFNMVAVAAIYPAIEQPRSHFDDEKIDELAQSLKEQGLLQPVLLRPSRNHSTGEQQDGGKILYEVIAGERRWRAAQRAGMHHIPALIRDINDDEMFELAIVENVNRENLNAMEEAKAYKKLMDLKSYRQEDLSTHIGKSRSHIANILRLLQLPEKAQILLEKNQISMGHARAILPRNGVDKEFSEKMAMRIVQEKLSVRDTERLMSAGAGGQGDSHKNKKQMRDPDVVGLEKELGKKLGLAVSLDVRGGKGKISFKFNSLNQLDSLLALLTKS